MATLNCKVVSEICFQGILSLNQALNNLTKMQRATFSAEDQMAPEGPFQLKPLYDLK